MLLGGSRGLLRHLGRLLGSLGMSFEALGASWEHLGGLWGSSWVPLWLINVYKMQYVAYVSWSKEVLISRAGARNPAAAGLLAASCLPLGASWEPLGGIWDLLGAS